ncbi:uncharacterized protein [Triticum aestivum]|uniref:uncharacterized protein n=1 Tax=Triticum aestivum TaxID=4565 RepID=UPI001D008F34|nr:uncharacterized protein LOC123039141 [Triticum aestivum]
MHYGTTSVAVDAMIMLVHATTNVLRTQSPCQAHNTRQCTPAKLLGSTSSSSSRPSSTSPATTAWGRRRRRLRKSTPTKADPPQHPRLLLLQSKQCTQISCVSNYRASKQGTGDDQITEPCTSSHQQQHEKGSSGGSTRAGELRAAAHEKGSSRRQHEQGRSSKLRRSSRRGSILRSRTAKELEDELEGARGPGGACPSARDPAAREYWAAAAQALRGRRGYRGRRYWAAEEHVLCGDGASRAAQVLGGGGACPVRRRSKQGSTGPRLRRSTSSAAAEQAIGRRRSWADDWPW